MRKRIYLLTAILITVILTTSVITAQAQWNTTSGNLVVSPATYLGTDGSSTSPLQIKTVETGTSALPIDFYTGGIGAALHRIRINTDNATHTVAV